MGIVKLSVAVQLVKVTPGTAQETVVSPFHTKVTLYVASYGRTGKTILKSPNASLVNVGLMLLEGSRTQVAMSPAGLR